ncbi:hypothetical protein [Campylobacter concisus]|jgi:hypothetical protein|uniref:hypothetical protein n=1 Tax=Campylobacter concisus TaxID=199 RepID=UPI000D399F17|nr:hypothetical protein [Campylobacter concisus]
MFERNSFAPTLGVLLGILLVMTGFLAFSFGYLLDFEEPLFASFCIWAFLMYGVLFCFASGGAFKNIEK